MLRRLLITGGLVNAALAATEVALTGYVRQHHALWAAGPLLAGVSAGSIVGSLLLGARGSDALAGETARRLPRLLACYALGLAALTAASLYRPAARRRGAAGGAVPWPVARHPVQPGFQCFRRATPAAAPRRKAG